MDILLTIFLFIIGFVISVIGFPRTNGDLSVRTTFFMGVGGFIFILVAFMMFVSPIETITGLSTTQNDSVANMTYVNTDIVFTEMDSAYNSTFALIFLGIGLFIMFFAALTFPRNG